MTMLSVNMWLNITNNCHLIEKCIDNVLSQIARHKFGLKTVQ